MGRRGSSNPTGRGSPGKRSADGFSSRLLQWDCLPVTASSLRRQPDSGFRFINAESEIMRAFLLWSTIVLLLLGAGCRRGVLPKAVPSPPTWSGIPSDDLVFHDNQSGIRETVREVVRDPQTFLHMWEQVVRGQMSPPPHPAIDFDQEMVLVVAAGRMMPGDDIVIDSLLVQEDRGSESLTVLVRTEGGCARLRTDAYPIRIVRVHRVEGPVHFVERREKIC
jgi:hypothetical protein